ncbi:MAG: hypothetical protein ABSB09_16185 [Acidimicrobiales bacterium]|jgi:hypothetical protein
MKRAILAFGLAGTSALVVPMIGAVQAGADYAPQPGDVVAVSGDTAQFAGDFLSNGDYNGDAGFNSAGGVNRLVTFDATPDANGRSAYTNSVTTGAASVALNPTDVLRAGSYPVQRVSSSGNAISALLADTGSQETINFVFSSSLPTAAQDTQAANDGWGYLHVVEIGTDSVQIAADTTTNAPTAGEGGLTAAELLTIYTSNSPITWSSATGGADPSTADILPLLPPSGSSIYKTFIAALTTANGGTAPSIGSIVKSVEQNDPTTITGSSSPANAIAPFSQARLNLWNDGYFHNPATAFPGGSTLTAGISLLSGYNSPLTDYVLFRQSDAASTTPFEPGGTENWVQTLFSGTRPFVDTSGGQALIQAAGVTPVYDDLGSDGI